MHAPMVYACAPGFKYRRHMFLGATRPSQTKQLCLTIIGLITTVCPMSLLVCILKDYRAVEALLLAFLELDVTGSTVIEGRGMGQIVGDVPIFAGLRGHFPGSAVDSQVVLTVIDDSKVTACMEAIEATVGPLDEPGMGIAFTLPLGRAMGLASKIK